MLPKSNAVSFCNKGCAFLHRYWIKINLWMNWKVEQIFKNQTQTVMNPHTPPPSIHKAPLWSQSWCGNFVIPTSRTKQKHHPLSDDATYTIKLRQTGPQLAGVQVSIFLQSYFLIILPVSVTTPNHYMLIAQVSTSKRLILQVKLHSGPVSNFVLQSREVWPFLILCSLFVGGSHPFQLGS